MRRCCFRYVRKFQNFRFGSFFKQRGIHEFHVTTGASGKHQLLHKGQTWQVTIIMILNTLADHTRDTPLIISHWAIVYNIGLLNESI